MIDWSCDLSTMEKTFAQNHFTIMDWSHDVSNIEKNLCKWKIDAFAKDFSLWRFYPLLLENVKCLFLKNLQSKS